MQSSCLRTCYEITLRWMPQNITNEKSTLDQVMSWCQQATTHYLSQFWLRSVNIRLNFSNITMIISLVVILHAFISLLQLPLWCSWAAFRSCLHGGLRSSGVHQTADSSVRPRQQYLHLQCCQTDLNYRGGIGPCVTVFSSHERDVHNVRHL